MLPVLRNTILAPLTAATTFCSRRSRGSFSESFSTSTVLFQLMGPAHFLTNYKALEPWK